MKLISPIKEIKETAEEMATKIGLPTLAALAGMGAGYYFHRNQPMTKRLLFSAMYAAVLGLGTYFAVTKFVSPLANDK